MYPDIKHIIDWWGHTSHYGICGSRDANGMIP